MSSSIFRTRQAPSPTGYLHLGTARTVLFTKLLSTVNSGTWFLRLEDTDRSRLQPEAVLPLLSALEDLGLQADEGICLDADGQKDAFYGISQKGKFGPYIQSERQEIYLEHAQKLIDKKLAYWSYLTAEDKDEIQNLKQLTKEPINYFKENLKKHPKFKDEEYNSNLILKAEGDQEILFQPVQKALKDEQKPALMYRLQRDQKIDCYDQLLGKSEFDLKLEEDFVILKSDGFPTYHLAHLIDDYLMETTVVIRGQEWMASLPKHVTMFRDYWGQEVETKLESANGRNVPDYLHLPLILGETGNKKMSKRDGNVNMRDYLDKGYLPEAIINYLAFLGWNPGTDQEIYL